MIIKDDLLKKYINDSKNLSFESFVSLYEKVENLMFIQNVIDYL